MLRVSQQPSGLHTLCIQFSTYAYHGRCRESKHDLMTMTTFVSLGMCADEATESRSAVFSPDKSQRRLTASSQGRQASRLAATSHDSAKKTLNLPRLSLQPSVSVRNPTPCVNHKTAPAIKRLLIGSRTSYGETRVELARRRAQRHTTRAGRCQRLSCDRPKNG